MKISVIIPTLNEEYQIDPLVTQLQAMGENAEIIVVDGGSTDQTLAKVKDRVILVTSSPGRAIQMNKGAQIASGEVLLFIHADSFLSPNSLEGITTALRNPSVVGGCFRLEIASPSPVLKVVSVASNLRARFFKLIFGDQGFFVRKEIFQRVGGYPELELMEDWEFSKLLHGQGKVVKLPIPIYTSPRRWEKNGLWKTIWLMHKIKLLYLLGVPPSELKGLYRNNR